MLKFEFKVKAIIMFVKSIKKDIEWYAHFTSKSIIWTVIILPTLLSKEQTVITKQTIITEKNVWIFCIHLKLTFSKRSLIRWIISQQVQRELKAILGYDTSPSKTFFYHYIINSVKSILKCNDFLKICIWFGKFNQE